MFSLPIFYQMLNKRSKQHSLLHFLTGKLDQTGFLILLWQFDLLDMLCGKAHEKNNLQCWKFNLLVKCKRECVLIVSNVQFGSVLKIFLLLIFSDLPYKNRKLKKKFVPSRAFQMGQYSEGIVNWSSAIFFLCWRYFLILLSLPYKYQSASQFQTRKEEPKRKWIDN